MKKNTAYLLSLLLILSLAGCGKTPDGAETETTEARIIKALPTTIDLEQLTDCTLAVALEPGSLTAGEGGTLTVTVYDYEKFDLVEISQLEVGSTLSINNALIEITELETNALGTVIINGGLDAGGYELFTNEDGVYYSIGYSDVKTYYEIGEITFDLSPDFVYIDASDLDAEEKIFTASEALELDYAGTPHNTRLLVTDGAAVSLTRIYVP